MAKAKVVWRERALLDVSRLYDFLFDKDKNAAMRAAQIILRGGSLLEESPRLGRPMSDGTKRRELFMSFGAGAYVLRYMLESSESVVIVRVWHSKENR